MTVRNCETYVEQAISSVRSQNNLEWELIIFDDGSTDRTPDIISRTASADSRVKFNVTTGIGRGHALNHAIALCSSEIVVNIDADDLLHPDWGFYVFDALRANPSFSVIAGRSQLVYEDSCVAWRDGHNVLCELRDVTSQLALGNPISHTGVAMRASALAAVGAYDADRESQFDYDLWVRLGSQGYLLGFSDHVCCAKRSHAGQSFERKRHIVYAFRAAAIQWRARLFARHNRVFIAANILVHIFWAFLPARVRMSVRKRCF